MAEWIGKPRRRIEEMEPYWGRSPVLAEFFINAKKPRVSLVIPYELFDEFKEAITKKYGSFSAPNMQRAASEAIRDWISKIKQ
ncbi:MAG: hypothetical protein QXS27_05410 [Candidatus Jordarchaeaceae archaeon]